MVELGECQTVPAPTTPQKKFALTRLFSSSSKKAEDVGDLAATPPTLKQGDVINLDGFGGEFSLTDGERATLSDLLTLSVGGIVVFTYPKASTPGCELPTSPLATREHTGTHLSQVNVKHVCLGTAIKPSVHTASPCTDCRKTR